VLYDGVEIPAWRDGLFRCPWKCNEGSLYSQPKWKTEKGFKKHLDECSFNPNLLQSWKPEPEAAREKFGTCPDCGGLVWRYASIWQMMNRWVCWNCKDEYAEAGEGYLDCAGLELPKVMLEGF
jgi:hypothetical protein